MKVALVFPGQGSQEVGMGAELRAASAAAGAVFDAADEALGFALSELCFAGPEGELQLTANTQPAILTTSVAAWAAARERLGDEDLDVVVAAGHSLGEYSALVAAGALRFADAVRLVRSRGELMQEAVPAGEGAMAAILGLDDPTIERVTAAATADGGVCTIANLNAPGQTVIAGSAAAVARAVEGAKEAGAKRALSLAVSAPFHCPMMAPARRGMEPLLAQAEIATPRFPVVCNVEAEPLTDPEAIRSALLRQIDQPVRWVESVRRMIRDFAPERLLELGNGRVLAGLNRRIEPSVPTVSIGTPGDLAQLEA